ncbi:hypothetical protein B5S28_g4858 [[Candida] boidinii]|uniref:Unnamed protein product n=1 Tax=Candida boidinii TaxID=5477 RepID=A0ACB5TGL0_CANBO|nr:hypothetical protein B5S28_g4858 [[Candida] boidinii]OWB64212.1 hypothetical protein B5S29_g5264 [[Candida] boidinii]OWB75334.1 hypothetical protein B5S31_g5219 [[Candida] boidinii]OWB80795.1 hypothetical protein B5S32_g5099 [[Candida] boidinii]GME87850.1 unnamed protein product [[Candida] boidinii]
MSQHHQSSRQDYIAKVRYLNDLPAPPCPPKLINSSGSIKEGNTTTRSIDEELKSSTFLSSYFRKDNFRNLVSLNNDLGMDMNLLKVPDCIEQGNVKRLGQLSPEYINGFNLHPDDRALLIDPSTSSSQNSDMVSFLRRTQYISSDRATTSDSNGGIAIGSDANIKKRKFKEDNNIDLRSQLRLVEDMFDTEDELSKIKHPTKRHLKAKKVWNFLPDTSMLDQKYYNIKFVGSASITKSKNRKKDDIKSEDDPRLLTSVFRTIQFNEENWVTLYNANKSDAEVILEKLRDVTENAPITEEELENQNPDDIKTYIYKRIREYDGQRKLYGENENFRHLAITFDENTNTALYFPVNGFLELKKRRIDPYLETRIKELTYDQIYLSMREPTQEEINERDNIRNNYDPMEFGAEDQEIEEV